MEELKLVMQTLAGLGATAKEGFIWWLVIDSALPKLLLAAFGAGLIWIAYSIAVMVSRDSALEKHSANGINEIAGLVGVSIYRPYSSHDVQLVVNAVRRLKNGG